ncbi:MAG TPA: septal ring lytic transglycosylase RlpA family protein [Candidatus Saccharimonadales bacterium]|nr:septal ring lytic transglycosylase RlpA family protein [Candidatus Saccharimonadales bacterium]
MASGCAAHKQPAQGSLPPPAPAIGTNPSAPPAAATTPQEPEIVDSAHAKVLYSETGWASWYGPHYNNRRSSNGEVYDMDGMTAAHRTLPLNSIAQVTNVKTGESVLLRITDRGPFVGDRIIDLSRAAAQKLDVYRRGTALVRIDVLKSPSPILTGGKWSVQIGPFKEAAEAVKLKDRLSRRYHTAKVLQFTSPIQEVWLRVRVADDDKHRAESVMQETHTDAGMYLLRMD